MRIKQENWEDAAIIASNISELALTLGEINKSVDFGKKSVEYADRSGDWQWKMAFRTTHADALHQSGKLDEAETLFLEAEAMQQKSQPGFHFLYSLQGFQFCDLLLAQGKTREALERSGQTLEWAKTYLGLLEVALDLLTLGRAWMAQAMDTKETGDFNKAKDYLDQAVAGLRKSGYQDFLSRGLIARAAYYRVQKDYNKADEDLNEAKEIAEIGGMKLFICDYNLEAGRLSLARGEEEKAKGHFQVAKEMIDKMGYHRRDKIVP